MLTFLVLLPLHVATLHRCLVVLLRCIHEGVGWRGNMFTLLVLLPLHVAMLHVKKYGSFEHLKLMANRKRTMLLTDGATCYPKMARETKTLDEWIAHNCGEFENNSLPWNGENQLPR